MSCPKCESPIVSSASNIDRWLICADCGHGYERRMTRYDRLMADHPVYDPLSSVKPGKRGRVPFHIQVDSSQPIGTIRIVIPQTASNLDEPK